MINLKGYKGFALLGNDSSLEANRLIMYCYKKNIPLIKKFRNNDICPDELIPCSTVEWITLALKYDVTPDYYPEWMKKFFHRKIWRQDKWILGKKFFVKPADRHKRFDGFITKGTYSKKKKSPLIWSEIVSFQNEWRYYVTAGNIIASEWYAGDELEPPAPKLNVNIPNNFYGTLDMGMTDKSKFALVEAHPPFACGWYGKTNDDEKYFQWLIDGWDYLKNEN